MGEVVVEEVVVQLFRERQGLDRAAQRRQRVLQFVRHICGETLDRLDAALDLGDQDRDELLDREVAAAWGKGRLSIVAAKGRAEAGMGPSGEFCSAAHAEALPSPRDFKA